MKILLLEDDSVRIAKVKQMTIGHNLDIATTAKAAIDFLHNQVYDVVSLDHDLGGKQMVASDENSGCAVAKFIYVYQPQFPRRIIVHSFNPIGADKMLNILQLIPQSSGMELYRLLFGVPQYWEILTKPTIEGE